VNFGNARRTVDLDHLIEERLERRFDPLEFSLFVHGNSICNIVDEGRRLDGNIEP
jgi:hypothetical protein